MRRTLPVLLSLAAFAYLFSIVDVTALSAAVRGVPLQAWLAAALLCALSLSAGAVRWWLLFRAFGAPSLPRFAELARHYATGFFYNTYLPGGLSGDVVRGIATQRAFGPGSAGGFATVIVERALGLSALLGLVAAATLLHPRLGLGQFQSRALAVFGLGLVLVLGIASLGRIARYLPVARLRTWLSKVPVPQAYGPLLLAWLLSLICQIAPTFAGHILLCAIHPPPSVFDSLAIVPIAGAAAFLPFSVSGAGFREAVFVELYAQVGVPPQASLAAALCLWALQAFLAGLCGVYVLFRRR
ncbi:MAG TPA: lysylphosphatidylglycerol synthase transmembrane domain-containing protein [Polyangiales bacterium]|nr:lysylphosphatidylglycerol synthase transmembrane domain-containing protein [Polyangiales bacterium]